MADLPSGLLDAVKAYLNITWQDEPTNTEITGYINRGMARLQHIAGAPLDFSVEDQPRSLLLDYCRYARSKALEVFEKNFEAELMDLNINTQAVIIDRLVVIAVLNPSAQYDLTVASAADEGNTYVYQVGTDLKLPQKLDTCIPGNTWTLWNGFSQISATTGQTILVVEINSEYGAERAGTVTV